MCIHNNPVKYGIQIVMVCDTGTNYMIDAIPYLGSNNKTKDISLAYKFIEELTINIQGTNIYVMMDYWFTSIPLAEKLHKTN